jgi:hypothetical protein
MADVYIYVYNVFGYNNDITSRDLKNKERPIASIIEETSDGDEKSENKTKMQI